MSSSHPKTVAKNQIGSANTPLSALWIKNQYHPIRSQEIIRALYAFDMQVYIKNATSIQLVGLLAGGVLYDRKSFELDNESKKIFSELSKSWAKQMWRYLWALNFAAAIIDPTRKEGAHLPFVCLPLELVEVYVHRDYLGRQRFKYYRPGTGENADMRQEILNVYTFVRNPNFLSDNGCIISDVTTLMPEYDLSLSKKMQTQVADYANANPVLIYEEPIMKADPNTVPHLPTTGLYLGNGDEPHVNSSTVSKHVDTMGVNAAASRIPGNGEIYNGPPENKRKSAAYRVHENYSGIQELPPGKQLVTGPPITAPEHLLETETAFMEKVFQTFGVPLSMISNAASTAGMRSAGGNAGGKPSSGNNSNAKDIRQNYLHDMKNFTIGMIQIMYTAYYARHHYEQVKDAHRAKYNQTNNKKKKKEVKETGEVDDESSSSSSAVVDDYKGPSMEELVEECKVEVTIPGIPDDGTLRELFIMGALKYEYFRSCTALRYGIPETAFNEKLEMTLQELNGFQEEKEEATQAPAKKKSKT